LASPAGVPSFNRRAPRQLSAPKSRAAYDEPRAALDFSDDFLGPALERRDVVESDYGPPGGCVCDLHRSPEKKPDPAGAVDDRRAGLQSLVLHGSPVSDAPGVALDKAPHLLFCGRKGHSQMLAVRELSASAIDLWSA